MSRDNNFSDEDPRYYRRHGRGMGRGRGRGRHGRVGRPPVYYPVEVRRNITHDEGVLTISSFELQILQLADNEGLNQKDIAEKLEISQTSVWRYLNALRKRIAEALSEHHRIVIEIID